MNLILAKLRGRAVQIDMGEGVASVIGILWDIYEKVALVVSWEPSQAPGPDGKLLPTCDFILQWVDIARIRKVKTDALVRVFTDARRRVNFLPEPLYHDPHPAWHAINNAVSLSIREMLQKTGIESGFEGVYVDLDGKQITRAAAEAEIEEMRQKAKAIPAAPSMTIPPAALPTPEQIVPVEAPAAVLSTPPTAPV
jgi:hypothetical protein